MVQTITVVTVMKDRLSKKTERMKKTIQTFGNGVEKSRTEVMRFNKGIRQAGRVIETTTTGIQRFKMHLLSVMFFGMLVQRVFMDLANTGVEAMMKISEGQTTAGMAITRLSAAFQFLKYSIGDAIGTALLPHLDVIIDTIDAVADWIEQNPELTAGIISVGAAAGTAFFLIGTLGLGLQGVSTLLGFGPGGAGLLAQLGGSGGLVGVMVAVGGAAAIASAMWQSNWADIQTTTKTQGNALIGLFSNIYDSLVALFETDWERLMMNFRNIFIDAAVAIGTGFVKMINELIARYNMLLSLMSGGRAKIPLIPGDIVEKALGGLRVTIPTPTETSGTTGAGGTNQTIGNVNIEINQTAGGATLEEGLEAGLAATRSIAERMEETASKYGYTIINPI